MERGIYFDGWFKHNHCYHPSLPLRSLEKPENVRFVETKEDLKASMEGFGTAFDEMYRDVCTVTCSDRRLGIHRFDADGKTYVYLLNYLYNNEEDKIETVNDE